MPFTATFTSIYELAEGTVFGTQGRTVTYLPIMQRLTGADKHHAQRAILSAALTAFSLQLSPLGSTPGGLFFLATDQPVDVRLGVSTATPISAVRQLIAGASISAIFLDTGSAVTKLLLEMVGGSNAVLAATIPFP